MKILVKQAQNFSVSLGKFCTPKNALYLKEQKFTNRTSWLVLVKINTARKFKNFPVLRVIDGQTEKEAETIYISARSEAGKAFTDFIKTHICPDVVWHIRDWNISSIGPRDKKIPEPMYNLSTRQKIAMCGEEIYMEERSTADRAPVGRRILSEVGYGCERMGVETPDYRR